MSLGLALNNALSGLNVNKEALTVLSQNLANANTEGYSRQILEQSARYVGSTGSGVQITDIVRKVDNYLTRSIQSQGSEVQRTDVINTYQDRVQNLLGQPGADNSLDSYLSNFFNVMQQFADTPDSASNRNNVMSSANALAGQISGLAGSLNDLRFQTDQDIADAVDVVNQSIAKLATLNKAIASASVSHQSTAGLLDSRDKELRTISEQLDVSVSYDTTGAVTVLASNGVTLVGALPSKLSFTPANSADTFTNDERMGQLTVVGLDESGNPIGQPSVLMTAAKSADVTSAISGGKIAGLQQLRDQLLPEMLAELDMLASNFRDAVNAVQNAGTAFPPPTSLTGTRAVTANEELNWTGTVRIAVLNADGSPAAAHYANESDTGLQPLLLDLSKLNSGDGEGSPTVQTIIDEINNHFSAGNTKTTLGNLNNIQLASDTQRLPSTSGTFNFDFDLQNISADPAQFFVTNVTVKDDSGSDMTAVSQPPATIALSTTNTYETELNSNVVTINMLSPNSGLKAGDYVYLSPPSVADVNGIDPAQLTGYVKVESVDGNQITVRTLDQANNTGSVVDGSGLTLQPPITVDAGAQMRSTDNGILGVDLSSEPNSTYYDITATISVIQPDGTRSNSDITYRVKNPTLNLYNDRYSSIAATGDATRTQPNTTQNAMRAILVDANGNELPSDNGKYANTPAYLELVGGNSAYRIAIDSMDSSQVGSADNPSQGTDRGFSFFFELNNFFDSNQPTATGDTVKGSAASLKVADRILQDPNLISVGNITQSNQPADTNARRQYTYQLNSGDNTAASAFASLANQQLNFAAAGDLPTTSVSVVTYAAHLIAAISANATAAKSANDNANTLYQGFTSREQAVSGVNIDEELANTITFQNAYSATARIISIVDEMYKDLINALGA